MLVIWLVLLLEHRPTVAHDDYPDCNDLNTYHWYGRNTSHKGLSNRQGFDQTERSDCDLLVSSSKESCGDCDFEIIKPDLWYRFKGPHEEILEIDSFEIADKCPEAGQCNGKNQIVLSKSDMDTRHKGSWFYKVVLSKDGNCVVLGKGREHDFVEKNDCDGFYLYRFPQLFAQNSCGGGQSGNPWSPASICMDDARKLSPFWVYLMVAISCALLIMIVTFVGFAVYRHRQMVLEKRRRSTHMYHQAAEQNRQSTHSYADLVTMGFQVSMPPPNNDSTPRDSTPIVADDNEHDGVAVFRNDVAADFERNAGWVDTDPLEGVSENGSLDSGLVLETETHRLSPSRNTDYLTPDELSDSRRTVRLHSYMNTPKEDTRMTVPQVSISRATQDYMIPDELVSLNPATHQSSPAHAAPTTSSSNLSSTLDPIALVALFSQPESGNLSCSSDRSDTPDLASPTSPTSRLRVPPSPGLTGDETCCIDSCTECPETNTPIDSASERRVTQLAEKTPQLDLDPLSVTWSMSAGRARSSRKCCNCRCSRRHDDRFYRIQSV